MSVVTLGLLLEHWLPDLSVLCLSLTRYQLEDESAHLDEMPLMMSEEGFENNEDDYHTLPRARVTRRKRGLGQFVGGGWRFLCTRLVVPMGTGLPDALRLLISLVCIVLNCWIGIKLRRLKMMS